MKRLRGKLTGLSGSSQAIARRPDFRPATTWSFTIDASLVRFSRKRQRIDVELRRRRQPAHALSPDVEVDHAAAIGRRIGKRREQLGYFELFVTPLVAVRVEERRAVHLARRPHPIEREGQHGPAGLRPELLLADIMRPAAAGDADRAAHHQEVDDAAIAHVLVIPVVHRRRR